MALTTLLLLLLSSKALGYVHSTANDNRRAFRRASSSSSRKIPEQGYYNPSNNGGSFLTNVANTYPLGQGEPINIIMSATSESAVLIDSEENGGLRNYWESLGFSAECLGQQEPTHQQANLGDGNGYLNESAVIRWDYGDPQLGTCKETIQGGNHFRYWVQDGSEANSGAIFMATSYEKPLAAGHDIIPNGYNLGRDYLIGNITGSTIPTLNLTNATTYSGSTSANGYTYQSDVLYVTGLLPNTSVGINHNLTVEVNGDNAADGFVAIVTVKITQKPQSASSAIGSPSIPFWTTISLTSLLILASFMLNL